MCGAVCYKIMNNRAIEGVHDVLNIFCLIFRSSHRISKQFVVVCAQQGDQRSQQHQGSTFNFAASVLNGIASTSRPSSLNRENCVKICSCTARSRSLRGLCASTASFAYSTPASLLGRQAVSARTNLGAYSSALATAS